MQFGLGANLRYFFSQDSSNFGGTFIFSQLADFQNTPPQPSEFMMNFGTPVVYFHQHEVFSFFQDEVRLRPDLSLDRKSTRLNSSHLVISYAVFCLKKKTTQ